MPSLAGGLAAREVERRSGGADLAASSVLASLTTSMSAVDVGELGDPLVVDLEARRSRRRRSRPG